MMNRWKKLNKEIKKISPPDDVSECLLPFRMALQSTLTNMKTTDVRVAYREVRASLMSDFRVSLALLDAAAYEEEILVKK